jgi:hypothetical protein
VVLPAYVCLLLVFAGPHDGGASQFLAIQRCAKVTRRGGALGWSEPCWLAVEPVDRVLASDHGREGGVVASDQRAVAAFLGVIT